MIKFDIPQRWIRLGLVLGPDDIGGSAQSHVVGDPCIVWDDSLPNGGSWRMLFFAQPPGTGQAIAKDPNHFGPGGWTCQGPVRFTNDAALGPDNSFAHKPYLVVDADNPNRAARIDGRYFLLTVNNTQGGKHKQIFRSWSTTLAGPWTYDPQPIIPIGSPGDFDAKHTDAVTAVYFHQRNEILYFYMGYPRQRQPRGISPWGSALGAAVQKLPNSQVQKLGEIVAPVQQPGHWAAGWIGGFQILPGKSHRWLAVLNASPTAPDPSVDEV